MRRPPVSLTSLLTAFFLINAVGFLFTGIAYAEEKPAAKKATTEAKSPVKATEQTTPSTLDKQASTLPAKFISDGQPIAVEKAQFNIKPPTGWEVVTTHPSLSLVMQEQESKKVVYDKPIYRRNITVATIHEPAPIDAKRAEQLKEEMLATFGKDAMVSNYEVLEQKFFNYKGENDGILIYTAMTMGEFSLMQMHTLVSSNEKQYLATYTDLADRFNNEADFQRAWSTMASLYIEGEPPQRYAQLIQYGSIGGVVLLLLTILAIVRRRRASHSYLEDADSVYSDDHSWNSDETALPLTQTGVWQLDSSGDLNYEEEASRQEKDKGSYESSLSKVSNFWP